MTIAGWYDDPTGRSQVRYFDGTAWTDNVATNGRANLDPITVPTTAAGALSGPVADPTTTVPPAAPARRRWTRKRIGILAGAGIVAIAAIAAANTPTPVPDDEPGEHPRRNDHHSDNYQRDHLSHLGDDECANDNTTHDSSTTDHLAATRRHPSSNDRPGRSHPRRSATHRRTGRRDERGGRAASSRVDPEDNCIVHLLRQLRCGTNRRRRTTPQGRSRLPIRTRPRRRRSRLRIDRKRP